MLNFLKQFLKNPGVTGSVMQSSNFLISSMLKEIDFSKDIIILELGPGNGCFTKKILKSMNKGSKLYSFEINSSFVNLLNKIDDNRLEVIEDSAENIGKYLKGSKADYILSSLPLASLEKFNQGIVKRILEDSQNNLKDEGIFLQYQYFLSNKKDLAECYSNMEISFQPLNLPPAFVYKCNNNQI